MQIHRLISFRNRTGYRKGNCPAQQEPVHQETNQLCIIRIIYGLVLGLVPVHKALFSGCFAIFSHPEFDPVQLVPGPTAMNMQDVIFAIHKPFVLHLPGNKSLSYAGIVFRIIDTIDW